MSGINSNPLDPVLHQPVRTQIVAFLHSRNSATFSELKELTSVTDGNLDSHLKKLKSANYVCARKEKTKSRAVTVFQLTESGKNAFEQYVCFLQGIIGLSK